MVGVQNLARALDDSRERGYLLVGLDSSGDVDLGEAALRAPLAVVMEPKARGCGIDARHLLYRGADRSPGQIKSLNVSNAAALALNVGTKKLGTA